MFQDLDPEETQEWLDAFEGVLANEGDEKGQFLLEQLQKRIGGVTSSLTSPYCNTVPSDQEARIPGDLSAAKKLIAYIRWNAMVMVSKANKKIDGIGGHIASFASSAMIYETGFNYFFNGPNAKDGPDLIFYQGHSSPGMYARAFLEGRLTEENLLNFRQEAGGRGVSSYPHPRLMPGFWQFPTVSMGLGPLMAIYQAHFMKYLENRNFLKIGQRKIWTFLGDGELDEPETLGLINLAARENLDHLTFVLNCNLQRLDGLVRSNGKVIQEVEGIFRGAGWNVIKVLWSKEWDPLFAKDTKGILLKRLEGLVDGDFQHINIHYKDPVYIRKHLFNTPELESLLEGFSDEMLSKLSLGGHDFEKIYAAMYQAVQHKKQPTIIIFQTVKGWGMGAGAAANDTHSIKKLSKESLIEFRDFFEVPLQDEQLEELPFITPEKGSPELEFLRETRQKLGGSIPKRESVPIHLEVPELTEFKTILEGTGDRAISTTMGFVRIFNILLRNKVLKDRIVPIIPDEARTFGMEGLFKQIGIYNSKGQNYTPIDKGSLMWYREDSKGQLLEEGISEAGGFCSWLAAGTSHTNNGVPMIPFFIYYSMFGFQRFGDLAWAAGDLLARGFLIGAISGKTTLSGEGLQHQDGHNILIASSLPTCQAYDPAFAYEMAVVIQDGLKRMYQDDEAVFYYITAMNENYPQPAMPEGVEEDIRKGMYLYQKSQKKAAVNLMGSGGIFREAIAAAEILETEYNIPANVWSVPGIIQLQRDCADTERERTLNPTSKRKSHLENCLSNSTAPVVISTDYNRGYGNLIAPYIKQPYYILGTDGYGRSDSREALREHFEVSSKYIVLTALRALVDQGTIEVSELNAALKKYKTNAKKTNPRLA